jgi:regulatory protein
MAKTISALRVQKKNKARVNVYLDGEFAFGLATVEAIRLRRGQVLSEAEIAALQARDEVATAHQRALNLLARRPRSQAEIQRYLSSKGYQRETIEQVCARLTHAGLLDDRAFARFWLDNRAHFRPRGARALRQELRQKGVPADVIEELLNTEHDEDQAAERAAWSAARRWQALDAQTFHKKLASFLIRRGFSYEIARQTTARVWRQLDASNPNPFDEN